MEKAGCPCPGARPGAAPALYDRPARVGGESAYPAPGRPERREMAALVRGGGQQERDEVTRVHEKKQRREQQYAPGADFYFVPPHASQNSGL